MCNFLFRAFTLLPPQLPISIEFFFSMPRSSALLFNQDVSSSLFSRGSLLHLQLNAESPKWAKWSLQLKPGKQEGQLGLLTSNPAKSKVANGLLSLFLFLQVKRQSFPLQRALSWHNQSHTGFLIWMISQAMVLFLQGKTLQEKKREKDFNLSK